MFVPESFIEREPWLPPMVSFVAKKINSRASLQEPELLLEHVKVVPGPGLDHNKGNRRTYYFYGLALFHPDRGAAVKS